MVKHIADNVLKLAESSGVKLPIYEVARNNMDLLEDVAGPTADVDGLYGLIRTMSGLPFANS